MVRLCFLYARRGAPLLLDNAVAASARRRLGGFLLYAVQLYDRAQP